MAARKTPKARPAVANDRPTSDDRTHKVAMRLRPSAHRKLLHVRVESGRDIGAIVSDLIEREYGGCYWAERSTRPTPAIAPAPADPPDDAADGPRLAEAI